MTGVGALVGVAGSLREEDARWRFLRRCVAPAVARVTPVQVYGADRVPAFGGVVVAANHFSAVDHPVLALASPRPVCFLAKAEVLAWPLLGAAFAWTGAVAVRRGESDHLAVRRATELVASGRTLAVHLEGTRQRSGRPGAFKPGAVAIAMRAGAPVVPCGLDTFGWTPENRRTSCVVFGEPVSLSDLPPTKAGREAALERVGAEVVRLWHAAVTARGAGFPPELPDGTRRSGGHPTRRRRDARTPRREP